MAKWSLRNYNAFMREAKDEFGISHRDAQALYRDMRDTLDRPIYGVDVGRHYDVAVESLGEAAAAGELQVGVEALTDDVLEVMDEYIGDYIDAGEEIEFSIEYESTD